MYNFKNKIIIIISSIISISCLFLPWLNMKALKLIGLNPNVSLIKINEIFENLSIISDDSLIFARGISLIIFIFIILNIIQNFKFKKIMSIINSIFSILFVIFFYLCILEINKEYERSNYFGIKLSISTTIFPLLFVIFTLISTIFIFKSKEDKKSLDKIKCLNCLNDVKNLTFCNNCGNKLNQMSLKNETP